MKYDIRAGLEKHMPSFLGLLGDNNISWRSINKTVNKFLNQVREDVKTSSKKVEKEASFYSIIISKKKGDGRGDAQFDFYSQLFRDLTNILTDNERQKISYILRSILCHPNKDYLNFIGELSVLYFYKINGHFNLLNVEEKIGSQRNIKADFLLESQDSGEHILVEVVNIHLEHFNNLQCHELEEIINSKLELKIEQTIVESDKAVGIQPFIWARNYDQIKILSDYYNSDFVIPKRTMPPLCYLSLKDEQEKYYHRINFPNQILDLEHLKN